MLKVSFILSIMPFFVNTSFAETPVKLDGNLKNDTIRVTATFEDATENRSHRPWLWDEKEKIYKSADISEDILVLIWSKTRSLDTKSVLDAWFWKAERTDPSKYADDFLLRINPDSTIDWRLDKGDLCWRQRFPANFAGKRIPRFLPRIPTQSQSDVIATGTWSDGAWTVTFTRKLSSNHPDDLIFSPNEPLFVAAFVNPPRTKAEIEKQLIPFSINNAPTSSKRKSP